MNSGTLFPRSKRKAKIKSGRGDRIRTYDLLVPNQALYQAKLHPETRRRARAFRRPVKPGS
jgi:hypothetical protein